jgi:hypothetical protein
VRTARDEAEVGTEEPGRRSRDTGGSFGKDDPGVGSRNKDFTSSSEFGMIRRMSIERALSQAR